MPWPRVARCGRGCSRAACSALAGGCVVRLRVAPLCCGPVPAVFVPGLFLFSLGALARCLSFLGSSMSASFASFASSLPVVGACSSAVRRGLPVSGARLVRAAVGLARARLAGAAVGLPVLPVHLARARSAFALARDAGCSPARLAVLARVGRLLAAAVEAAAFAGSGFLPASLSLGSAGVVSSSAFREVASGVVLPVGSVSVEGGSLWVRAPKFSARCLLSGLGGAGSADAVALERALLACCGTGLGCTFFGAPGASGRVAYGFFCGVASA